MIVAVRHFFAILPFLAASPALGQTVSLDLAQESRSEALAELIPEGSAEITWRNPALADEPVTGHFEGTEAQVLKQLLAPANFAATYSDTGGELKLIKLIIFEDEAASGASPQESVAPLTTPVAKPQEKIDPKGAAASAQYRLEKQRKVMQLQQQRQQQPGVQPDK